MARRAELIALTVERIHLGSEGDGTALIYMSKVDREEPRYLSAEVVTHLNRWLAHAKIGPHPFRWTVSNLSFRPLILIQRITQRSLPPQAAEVPR